MLDMKRLIVLITGVIVLGVPPSNGADSRIAE
jgi:hypothetical protein